MYVRLKDKTQYLSGLTETLKKPREIIRGLDYLEVKRIDGRHVVVNLPNYGSFWISGESLEEVMPMIPGEKYMNKIKNLLEDC